MFLTITDIKDIATRMESKIGVDYPNYNLSFLRRRIGGIFEKLCLHKVQDFMDLLENQQKADEIAYYMQVPSTELFRDPAYWRALRKNLCDKKSLSIWFPELTNGYELYSLCILLKQMEMENVKIVASTPSQKVIDSAKTLSVTNKFDEINRSNFERLETSHQYEEYVTSGETSVSLKPELLKNVDFHKSWFMNEPIEKFDVIIFRNALLNYSVQLHERAIERLVSSLRDGALIAIGIKETILSRNVFLEGVNMSEGIYGLNV